MDIDISEIDVMNLSNQHDSVPMNNILENTRQTPTVAHGLTWPTNVAAPILPSFPIQPSQIENNPDQPAPQPKCETHEDELNDDPPIDRNEAHRLGGVAYAVQCRERARQQCKSLRKKEHMANGNHDFVTRRRKGENCGNDQESYDRRLKKNQDSAHASRYAQKVYVHVLERLVKNGDEEKNALELEVKRLREENCELRQANGSQTRQSQLAQANNNGVNFNGCYAYELFGNKGDGRYDSHQVAKLIDMLTSPEQVSAQAQDHDFAEGRMGIQPSRAV